MDTNEKEMVKRGSGILALSARVNIEPLKLVSLDRSVLYAWLLSLGYHYDENAQDWFVDLFQHNAP